MQSYTFLIPSKWTLTSLSHSNEESFSFSQAEHFKRKVSIILSKTEQLNTHTWKVNKLVNNGPQNIHFCSNILYPEHCSKRLQINNTLVDSTNRIIYTLNLRPHSQPIFMTAAPLCLILTLFKVWTNREDR